MQLEVQVNDLRTAIQITQILKLAIPGSIYCKLIKQFKPSDVSSNLESNKRIYCFT